MDQSRPRLRLGVALLLTAGLSGPALACEGSGTADVTIGLREAPPFVSEDAIRGRRGLVVDLWSSVERELRAAGAIGETEFVDCPLGEQLEALAAGRLDLVISPLTITAERMERFDFTHQYLNSGLTVAQRASSTIDFGHAAAFLGQTVTQPGVPRAILIFLLLNLALAAILARLLRQHDDFEVIAGEAAPVRLYRYSMEAVVRTIGLYGLGDNFRSTAAKSLEVAMAVVGAVLSATIFGVLTAAFIGSIGHVDSLSMEELPAIRVATLEASTARDFLEQLSRGDHSGAGSLSPVEASAGPARLGKRGRVAAVAAPAEASPVPVAAPAEAGPVRCLPAAAAPPESRCRTAASWSEAMDLLVTGEVDAVLGDWAQLSYLARLPALAGRVEVQPEAFRLEPYGWGVSPARPELRAAVDRALIDRVRNPEWRFLVQEYMGDGAISPQ